jgi:hypothetical protein
MAQQIKTAEADIQIQMREGDHGHKIIMIRFNGGCWQEVVLPSSIVKEKIIDAKFWKYIINYLIKE